MGISNRPTVYNPSVVVPHTLFNGDFQWIVVPSFEKLG